MEGEQKLTESGLGVMHDLANGKLEISVEDVRKAMKKLKGGKSPGVDGITSEMLKCNSECLLEWQRRICNVCVDNFNISLFQRERALSNNQQTLKKCRKL